MPISADRLIAIGMDPAIAAEVVRENSALSSGRGYHVCYDQNPPNTNTTKANVVLFERMPFDGMSIDAECTHPVLGSTSFGNNIWTSNPIHWPDVATALSNLQTTNFRVFQHNFLVARLTPSSTLGEPPLDWFDPVIETAIHNVRILARLARAGFCRGIWFDLEPDNSTAGWKLFKHSDRPFADTYDIDAYKARIKYIGRRVAEVLNEEYPGIHLKVSFTYDQIASDIENDPTADEEDRNYGMFGKFLDGIFDGIKLPSEIHDFREAGYAQYTETQLRNGRRLMENPAYELTGRYDVVRGNTTRPDILSAANLQTAVVNTPLYIAERYHSFYQETGKFLISPAPTIDADKIAAIRAGRVTLGYDESFDPALIPGLVVDFNPFLITGLANDASISSVTTATGQTYTQTGTNRPIYKTNGFGSGIPSVFCTAASQQYFICDAVAAEMGFSGTSDFGYTFLYVQDLTASMGATFTTIGLGNSSGTNAQIRCQVVDPSKYQLQRLDDAGGTDAGPITEASGTADTSPHVISMYSDGIHGSIRVDGAQILTKQAQDVGTMTFNQHAIGASRGNSTAGYFGGHIGRVLIYNRTLGIEQLRWLERGLAAQHGITVS